MSKSNTHLTISATPNQAKACSLQKIRTSVRSLAVLALMGTALSPLPSPFTVQTAYASECLLNGGDGVEGADASVGVLNTACGRSANASGDSFSLNTAIGAFSDARGNNSKNIASGQANASGDNSRSIASGANAKASGDNSRNIAIGSDLNGNFIGADASGDNSDNTAIGSDADASGTDGNSDGLGSFNIATGRRAKASGDDSANIAIGADQNGNFTGADASGTDGDNDGLGSFNIAIGADANAKGDDSRNTAIGFFADATGSSSFNIASGFSARAFGSSSSNIALGRNSDAGNSNNGIAIGAFADAGNSNGGIAIGNLANNNEFDGAIVIGQGATASEAGQIVLGAADTFTILNNGNVGLGTASPSDALDIQSAAPAFRLTETGAGAGFPIRARLNNGSFRLSFVDGIATQFEMNTDADVTLKGQSPSLVLQEMDAGGVNEGDPMRLTIKNSTFRMSFVDGIATQFLMDTNGNVTLQGSLTTSGPACEMGCDAVFGADYDMPSIEEHAKSMYANSYLPAIGATKPNAPINLSEQYGNLLNELEKAHIYIAQMNAEMAEQKTEMVKIKAQLTMLINQ